MHDLDQKQKELSGEFLTSVKNTFSSLKTVDDSSASREYQLKIFAKVVELLEILEPCHMHCSVQGLEIIRKHLTVDLLLDNIDRNGPFAHLWLETFNNIGTEFVPKINDLIIQERMHARRN